MPRTVPPLSEPVSRRLPSGWLPTEEELDIIADKIGSGAVMIFHRPGRHQDYGLAVDMPSTNRGPPTDDATQLAKALGLPRYLDPRGPIWLVIRWMTASEKRERRTITDTLDRTVLWVN